MVDGESLIDRMILYTGIALAVLGIGGAGYAVVRAMCLKWLVSAGA